MPTLRQIAQKLSRSESVIQGDVNHPFIEDPLTVYELNGPAMAPALQQVLEAIETRQHRITDEMAEHLPAAFMVLAITTAATLSGRQPLDLERDLLGLLRSTISFIAEVDGDLTRDVSDEEVEEDTDLVPVSA
jgi:hypothetical protein